MCRDMYDKYEDVSQCYFLPHVLTPYVLMFHFPVISASTTFPTEELFITQESEKR